MSRALTTFLFAILLLLPGCGDLTPCESEINCVILCECANGGVGTSSGYRCSSAGYCIDGHKDDRDCSRICSQVVPPPLGNDDDAGAGNDDSAGDDDSASGDDDSAESR